MFIGHYALGFAAKRLVPRTSLGTLTAAPTLADLLWPVFLFAGLYRMRTGYARGALVVLLLVVSHWVLDWVTHRPDMPLYPGGPKVGLGLWTSEAGTVIVETIMFVAGAALYLAATRARDRIGRYGLWGFLAFLLLSYAASLFSPPPPSPRPIAIGAIVFGWLFVAWAGWVDRHREVT